MKKLFTLALVVFMAMRISAQESAKPLYLMFEFMQVSDENENDYLVVEDYWSGIHKQRVADKSIIGWDLWALTLSGTKQDAQYFTVTLFGSLKDMLQATTSFDVIAYAKKAYPNMSEKELNAIMAKTVKSRDIARKVFLRQVDYTTGDFTMKPGVMATMDVMKQLDDNYEKVESEIFKPWHQQMVDQGKKGNWSMLATIWPTGSEAYGTHLTVSMFKDAAQLAAYMEGQGGDMDLLTQIAVAEGLKSRDWKEVKVATLVNMVR